MEKKFIFKGFKDLELKATKYSSKESKNISLQITHGMAEDRSRYDHFAKFLAHNGIDVYIYDQRGHGESSISINKQGLIGENGISNMIEDMANFNKYIKKDNPNNKIIALGHSMGSFITQGYILKYSNSLDGVIFSGSNRINSLESNALFILASIKGIKSLENPDKFFNKLLFGKFQNTVTNPKTEFDWLSRDENLVNEYIKNPYCGALFPTQFYKELARGLSKIKYNELNNINKNLPVFIFAGDKDPVGKMGKGVIKLKNEFEDRNFTNIKFRLYSDGRHEMLNETNKDEVYKDILDFLLQFQ